MRLVKNLIERMLLKFEKNRIEARWDFPTIIHAYNLALRLQENESGNDPKAQFQDYQWDALERSLKQTWKKPLFGKHETQAPRKFRRDGKHSKYFHEVKKDTYNEAVKAAYERERQHSFRLLIRWTDHARTTILSLLTEPLSRIEREGPQITYGPEVVSKSTRLERRRGW